MADAQRANGRLPYALVSASCLALVSRCTYAYKGWYGRAGELSISAFTAFILASPPTTHPILCVTSVMAYEFNAIGYPTLEDVSCPSVRAYPLCVDHSSMNQVGPFDFELSPEDRLAVAEILGGLASSFDEPGELGTVHPSTLNTN